jgi:hypothetical protein
MKLKKTNPIQNKKKNRFLFYPVDVVVAEFGRTFNLLQKIKQNKNKR